MSEGRAIIAVIALYALFLQAFLGTLAPLGQPIMGSGALCMSEGSGSAPIDGECERHACCTTVQAPETLLPRPSGSASIIRVKRQSVPVAWNSVDFHGPRAPPDRSASPRGPPAA